jgi:hypothetical protein
VVTEVVIHSIKALLAGIIFDTHLLQILQQPSIPKTMAQTLPCEQLNASSASAVHICQLTLLQCH